MIKIKRHNRSSIISTEMATTSRREDTQTSTTANLFLQSKNTKHWPTKEEISTILLQEEGKDEAENYNDIQFLQSPIILFKFGLFNDTIRIVTTQHKIMG